MEIKFTLKAGQSIPSGDLVLTFVKDTEVTCEAPSYDAAAEMLAVSNPEFLPALAHDETVEDEKVRVVYGAGGMRVVQSVKEAKAQEKAQAQNVAEADKAVEDAAKAEAKAEAKAAKEESKK